MEVGGGLKRCPQCAEEVQVEARVCKHCGHRFDRRGWRRLAVATIALILVATVAVLVLVVNVFNLGPVSRSGLARVVERARERVHEPITSVTCGKLPRHGLFNCVTHSSDYPLDGIIYVVKVDGSCFTARQTDPQFVEELHGCGVDRKFP